MFGWLIQPIIERRRYEAERDECMRQIRQAQADYAPYARYDDALNGAIVGAPADPEAFG